MPEMKENKALLAMSGGVDSSAAGKLLRDAGYDCVGCTMKLYENEDAGLSRSRTCCSLEDVEDARSAAFRLGENILAGLTRLTGLRNRGMKVRPGLYVLRRTAMPAVLVELGFITNPSDAALMNTQPNLFADGIYAGILEYTGV